MKPLITLTLSLLIALISQAQLIVTVVDNASGAPIPHANVSAKNGRVPFFTSTNIDGQANIEYLQNYNGDISISCLGYQTEVVTLLWLKSQEMTITLKLTNLALDQVVVSASRYSQPKSTTPMKVATISPKQIEFNNPQTAADLLGGSGEVFIQKSQQGGGSPMIRGFATNRLLINVDGVRMNTSIFRSGNLQNVINIDPFTVSRTEILFGPNSVIYGSDAIGGVMSFYTLTPQLAVKKGRHSKISGNILGRFASASNEFTGHADLNIGWQKIGIVLSYSRNQFGDLKMGTNGPHEYTRPWYVETRNNQDFLVNNENPNLQTPSGYTQQNVMTKVLYKLNSLWDFTYGFHYSATSTYDRYDRLLETRNGNPRSAVWKYGPQKWMMNNLKIHNIANNDLFDEFTLRLAHQEFEESRIDRSFQDSALRKRVEEVLALSFNADFVKSIGANNTFFYGTEVVYNDVNSTAKKEDIFTGTSQNSAARYPLSQWYSYAVYLTYQHRLNDQLLLHAGMRYNHFILNADFAYNNTFYAFPYTTATINNGATTGSIGVDFNPEGQWTISTNFSTGFRSPNVDDIGKVFDSEPGSVVIPNPNLKAEYAYNLEIDVAKVFWNMLKVDIAVFYTYLQDALVRRNSSINGQDSIIYDGTLSQVQTLQNAAEAYVYGTEIGFDLELPNGFQLSSHYNFQKGFEIGENENVPLRHAAPQFGITKLTYKRNRLTTQIYSTFSGKMAFKDMAPSEVAKTHLYAVDSDGNPYSPAWYTLNIKALFRFNKHLLVTLGVENITDQRYRPYSSGLVAPGRNLIVSLKGSF